MDSGLLVVTVLIAGVISWSLGTHFSRRKLAQKILDAREEAGRAATELQACRELLVKSQIEAARLPDLMGRAERSELAQAQAQRELGEALSKRAALGATLESVQANFDALGQTLGQMQAKIGTLESQLALHVQSEAVAQASANAYKEQSVGLLAEKEGVEQALTTARSQIAELSGQHAQMRAERDATMASHEQTKVFLDEAQGRMRTVFIEAASKVFDEKAISLDQRIKESGEASRLGLEATIKPLSEQVGQFQQKVEAFTSDHARDFAKFEGSVGTIQKLNQDMADATNSLARALKGNAKTRGDWGEMILETVLKASGLVEGLNYVNQARATDEDSGKQVVPDVVVKFPDGRKVVVDSKVNLVAWTEANNASTAEEYEEAMLRHTAAVRQHMRDLSGKDYPRAIGSQALDFTVMFVPIEGALSAALSTNSDLQTEAMTKHVVFATPNTLMAMLRVVERMWIRDRLQRQVETIGSQAGLVLDALIDFMKDFDEIQKHLNRTDAAFRNARTRLHDSDRSVIARSKRLVEAGAKGRRQIPEALQLVQDATLPPPLALDSAAELDETLDESR